MRAHLCRHCQKAPASRPRRLCWSCYYRPGVRERYPSTSKFARQGLGLVQRCRPLPAGPTAALPGSPEKITVLEQRALLGLELWHPDDAILDRRAFPRLRLRARRLRERVVSSLIAG